MIYRHCFMVWFEVDQPDWLDREDAIENARNELSTSIDLYDGARVRHIFTHTDRDCYKCGFYVDEGKGNKYGLSGWIHNDCQA